MGCGSSTPAPSSSTASNPYLVPANPKKDDPAEVQKSVGIDRELDRARQQEELKVKLLLLGAGESGKSTIFKQMRILHGSPRTEDDQRMYGVVIRSNIITAMRKLCSHLRSLGLEGQLAAEPKADEAEENRTPKQAYDLIVAHVVDNTAAPEDLVSETGDGKDWVGQSPRAGLGANNDAKQFLQLWRPIKTLWEVSYPKIDVLWGGSLSLCHSSHASLHSCTVQNNEGGLVETRRCQRH
jgi:hypothetical protein